jgi:hypothetical protein
MIPVSPAMTAWASTEDVQVAPHDTNAIFFEFTDRALEQLTAADVPRRVELAVTADDPSIVTDDRTTPTLAADSPAVPPAEAEENLPTREFAKTDATPDTCTDVDLITDDEASAEPIPDRLTETLTVSVGEAIIDPDDTMVVSAKDRRTDDPRAFDEQSTETDAARRFTAAHSTLDSELMDTEQVTTLTEAAETDPAPPCDVSQYFPTIAPTESSDEQGESAEVNARLNDRASTEDVPDTEDVVPETTEDTEDSDDDPGIEAELAIFRTEDAEADDEHETEAVELRIFVLVTESDDEHETEADDVTATTGRSA